MRHLPGRSEGVSVPPLLLKDRNKTNTIKQLPKERKRKTRQKAVLFFSTPKNDCAFAADLLNSYKTVFQIQMLFRVEDESRKGNALLCEVSMLVVCTFSRVHTRFLVQIFVENH